MDLATFGYSRAAGWTPPSLPELDSDRTLVLAFGHSDCIEQPEPIHDLVSRYPRSHVVGCSTAGEILGHTLGDGGLSVAVLRFEQATVLTAHAAVASQADSFAAGQSLGRQLDRADLRGILILSEGLGVNGSELVRGLTASVRPDVTVTGGLAGDGERFARTWVIQNGEPRTRTVCAVGLYGPSVRVGHGSQGGWDIFGPERRVTRSEGNVLFELDNRPALQLYRQYLGDLAGGLPATGLLFPLAVRSRRDDPKSVVRTILAVDEDSQSMTFAGDLPEGALARLMRANLDRLIDGAGDAGSMSTLPDVDGPVLSIAISCVGRRLVLGERTEEEIEAVLQALPARTQQVGFYSYGEISPSLDGACDLHNQTMTLTTIGEAAAA